MALSDEKLSLVTIIVTFVLCMFWLTMTDSEFARKNTQAEDEMLERSFGTETAMAITNQADIWYDRYIVANDLEEKTLHHFVPTQEERNASRGIETMGDWLFPIVEERIVGMFDMIYWVFKRIALMCIWLPLLLPLLVVSIWDGMLQRRIKLENFGLASPLKQRIGYLGAVFGMCGILIWFFVPYAIEPHVAPALLGMIALLMGTAISNLQKRF